jgi:hypothetical protein
MDHWTATLNDHPVFESKQAFDDSLSISALGSARLDTSSSSRPEEDDTQDAFPPKQRAMVIRGNEVIVAVGSEIRVATMQSKSSRSFTVGKKSGDTKEHIRANSIYRLSERQNLASRSFKYL